MATCVEAERRMCTDVKSEETAAQVISSCPPCLQVHGERLPVQRRGDEGWQGGDDSPVYRQEEAVCECLMSLQQWIEWWGWIFAHLRVYGQTQTADSLLLKKSTYYYILYITCLKRVLSFVVNNALKQNLLKCMKNDCTLFPLVRTHEFTGRCGRGPSCRQAVGKGQLTPLSQTSDLWLMASVAQHHLSM